MKKYKDFIGCTATVKSRLDGYRLIIKNPYGAVFYDKVLKTERACKQVMSRFSDGTMREIGGKER